MAFGGFKIRFILISRDNSRFSKSKYRLIGFVISVYICQAISRGKIGRQAGAISPGWRCCHQASVPACLQMAPTRRLYNLVVRANRSQLYISVIFIYRAIWSNRGRKLIGKHECVFCVSEVNFNKFSCVWMCGLGYARFSDIDVCWTIKGKPMRVFRESLATIFGKLDSRFKY